MLGTLELRKMTSEDREGLLNPLKFKTVKAKTPSTQAVYFFFSRTRSKIIFILFSKGGRQSDQSGF